MRRRRKSSRGWATWLLLAIVLAGGFGAMEMAVRVLRPQVLVRAYGIADLELGTVLRPNVRYHDVFGNDYWVETNAQALRQPDDRDMARKGVALYGDSFTFGFGVDYAKSYFALIKAGLEAGRPDIQLLNAAVPGFGSGQVRKLMERQLPILKPAALVYFFNNNDLTDNVVTDIDYRVTTFVRRDDGRIELTDVRPFSRWKQVALNYTPYGWLNQHSHLFVLAKDMFKTAVNRNRSVIPPRIEGAESAPPAGLENAAPAYTVAPDLDLPSESIDTVIAVSLAHMNRIADLATQTQTPLLVVWVPSAEEMAPGANPPPVLNMLTRARAALGELARQRGDFTFVDTTRDMPVGTDWEKAAESLRFVGDGHFNAEGNAWFAGRVAPALGDFIETRLPKTPGPS